MTCRNQPLPFNLISMAFTSLSLWILHVVVWLEKYLLLDKRNWPLKKKRPLSLRTINQRKYVLYYFTAFLWECFLLLRATRGAHNPNVKVVITHASHVCSQLSVWTSTKNEWNGMHRTHFDHVRLDLQSLVILSRVFWPSVTWNVRKPQRWSKTFDRYRPHSVTFGYY